MPPRRSKIHTGVRIPPNVLKKMDELILSGEYLNKSDIIIDALESFFKNRDKNTDKNWLISEEGKHYLKDLIKKVKEEEI